MFNSFEVLYEEIKNLNIYYTSIFDSETETITYFSDEYESNQINANYLKIKKLKDSYLISNFKQLHRVNFVLGHPIVEPVEKDPYGIFPICFADSNSNSYYKCFFKRMYNNIQKIDDTHELGHQIHIEEYLFEREQRKESKRLSRSN